MAEERIKLQDTLPSAISKMSDGNPGAMHVMMEMSTRDDIDPDNFMGGFGKVLSLDSLGIYGSDIYVLHNDICGRDMVKTFTILRAHQLGFIKAEVIKEAAGRQDRSGKSMIDIEDLHKKVKERLPAFKDLETDKK